MIKVTAAIIEKNGMLLLAKRNKDDPLEGKWEFPGGKIEEGETPEECMKRELHEELGIDAEVGEFICSSQYQYDHISIELFAFKIKAYTGEIVPKDHSEIKWVAPSQFHEYDFPAADKPIIEKLIR
jgi:8-oxo-dGTP diphosphatase